MESYAYVVEHWRPLRSTKTGFGWTTEPPTQDGLYAAVQKEETKPTWVYVGTYVDGRCALNFDYEGLLDLSEYTHWLGPLPEPEPPKGEE